MHIVWYHNFSANFWCYHHLDKVRFMYIISGIVKIESLSDIKLEDGRCGHGCRQVQTQFVISEFSHSNLLASGTVFEIPHNVWVHVMHFWWPTSVLVLMTVLHKHSLLGISGTYGLREYGYQNVTFSLVGELPAALKNLTGLNTLWVPFSQFITCLCWWDFQVATTDSGSYCSPPFASY